MTITLTGRKQKSIVARDCWQPIFLMLSRKKSDDMEPKDVHGHLQQVSGFKDANIEYVEDYEEMSTYWDIQVMVS